MTLVGIHVYCRVCKYSKNIYINLHLCVYHKQIEISKRLAGILE